MSTIDAAFAKTIYSAYYGQRHWHGPYALPDQRRLRRARHIKEGLAAIVGATSTTQEGHLRVASAWHAAVLLAQIQHQLLETGQHLVFRGQAVKSWKLCTSLERAPDKQQAARAFQAFSILMGHAWSDAHAGVALPASAHPAVAQHYGIPTNLLDFTADPNIAVQFANDLRHDGETAQVFILPLASAEKVGATIHLPPPFVTRLHNQLGIFVHVENAASIRGHLSTIEFPIVKSYGSFIARRGGRQVKLLPRSAWLVKAAGWSKRWAASKTRPLPFDEAAHAELFRAFHRDIGYPPFATQAFGYELQLAAWIDCLDQLINWLAISIKDHQQYCNLNALQLIVKSNPELLDLAISLFGVSDPPRARLLETVREQL